MKNSTLTYLWVALGFLARLLPHLPNITPSSSVSLYAGAKLSKAKAILAVAVMMVISDILLALVHSHEIFGYWSIFTYSGFLAVILLGRILGKNFKAPLAIGVSVFATILFWLWTNFGTWLTSDLYTHDSTGLIACFSLAIPFLGASIVGDLVWMFVLFYGAEKLESLFTRATLPSKEFS